jgi:putative acyl-CoA dehydrogenase
MSQKRGITMGMAMTEKQGGSDIRTNLTYATPIAGEEGAYLLTGHKWFCSAPMSDAFLTLALVNGGLTCFFLPRWTPDGQRNRFHLQRLKDKLGNHANASSEVEFDQAWALRVGEEGAGVRTIIEMVHHTRLDASLANASLMRRGLTEALMHCSGRSVFGDRLIHQPLMRSVLADLWLESEAATLTTLSLAHAFDQARDNKEVRTFTRIATAVIKYWVCKRTPPHVYESMECHGGAGYVEESVLPRLYREAPLNSIWEGSGNVMCLDILRALQRSPEASAAFIAEVERGRGYHTALDLRLDHLQGLLGEARTWSPTQAAGQARRLGAELALCLQGSLMARYAPETVSVAFCEARLRPATPRVYGDLDPKVNVNDVLARAEPLLDQLSQLQG